MQLSKFLERYSSKMNYLEKSFITNVYYEDFGEDGLDLIEPQVEIDRNDGTGRIWRLDFVISTQYSQYAIECNGFNYHAEGIVSKDRFNELQQKSNEIVRQGFQFINLSKDQIIDTPEEAIYQLRRSFIADQDLFSIFLDRNGENIQPNKVQNCALEKLKETRKKEHKKGIVVLATGLGKTYLGIFDTQQLNARRILYIVHVGQVLKKARNSFEKILPKRIEDMGFFQGKTKDSEKSILFATIQTLSKDHNLNSFPSDYFDYIILDETHHLAAPTYKKVFEYFKPQFILGLTATPDRLDQQDILSFYDNNLVYQMDQVEAIKKGYLSGINYFAFKDNVDYSSIRFNGFKYDVNDLNKLLMIQKRDDAILNKYMEMAKNRKTIGFCVSTQHADWCAKVFNEHGIKAIAIHSKMDDSHSQYTNKDKDLLIKNFEDNEYQVAFVVDMFNEGVDFPDVDCILLLRPTESTTILTQQIGRGLRIAPGKMNTLVLDFIGNYHTAYKILPALGVKISDLKRDTTKGIYYYDNDGRKVTLTEEVANIIMMTTSQSTKEIRKEVISKEWIDYGEFIKDTTKSGSKLYWKVGNKNNFLNVHLWALDYINKLDINHESKSSEEVSKYIKEESRRLFPGKTMEGTRALFFSKILGLVYSDSPIRTTPVFKHLKDLGSIQNFNTGQEVLISNQLEKFCFWNDIFSLTDRHTSKEARSPINEYFKIYPLFFIYDLLLTLKDDYGYVEPSLTKFEIDFFVTLARTHTEITQVAERIIAFREEPEKYEIQKYLRRCSSMDPRFFKILKYSQYLKYSANKVGILEEKENDLREKVSLFKKLLTSGTLIFFDKNEPDQYKNLLYSTETLLDYHKHI